MPSHLVVTREVIEDTGIRPIGKKWRDGDVVHMDRRRLARELRRVRRHAAKTFKRVLKSRPPLGEGLERRNQARWWLMFHKTCRHYGVRA